MRVKFADFADKRAFTLMELMIVLLVIGILMSSVFMLMGVVGNYGNRARTKSRIQRLQNAISGFYAAYGTYPPVELHDDPDPFSTTRTSDFGDGEQVKPRDGSNLSAKACRLACRAQPVSFEYPNPLIVDPAINRLYSDIGVMGANQVYGGTAETTPKSSWKEIQMFKFGLMSYLLPRVELIGLPSSNESFGSQHPMPSFFRSKQWQRNNKTSKFSDGNNARLQASLESQRQAELREIAKWLPNLEHMIPHFQGSILGVDLGGGGDMGDRDLDGGLPMNHNEDDAGDEPFDDIIDNLRIAAFRGPYDKGAGSSTVLFCATVKDAWNQDLYYYSAPPYQGYRVWSAGPNGNTFPPWVPLESLSEEDLELVTGWISDDIVGFDRD